MRIIFILLLSFSSISFAEDDFQDLTKGQKNDLLRYGVGAYLDKNESLPNSRTELAKALGIKPGDITTFLSENFIETLFKTKNHREIIKSSLIKICEKAFANYFQLPKTSLKKIGLKDSFVKKLFDDDINTSVLSLFSEESIDKVYGRIVRKYVVATKALREFPSKSTEERFYTMITESLNSYKDVELSELDTQELIRQFFGEDPWKAMQEAGSQVSKFTFIINREYINEDATERLLEGIRTKDRIVNISIADGIPISAGVVSALKAFEVDQNAHINFIPLDYSEGNFDDQIKENNWTIVFDDVWFDRYHYLVSLNVTRMMDDPLTGLKDFGRRHETLLIGATKQRIETDPTADNKHIMRFRMTTGAAEPAAYFANYYSSLRRSKKAEKKHIQGGLVLEKIEYPQTSPTLAPHGEFTHQHFVFTDAYIDHMGKEVPAGFTYKGKRYTHSGAVIKVEPYGVGLGDTHYPDMTDLRGLKSAIKMINLDFPNIKILVLHDWMEGTPFSRHLIGKVSEKSTLHSEQLSFVDHINAGIKAINFLQQSLPNVLIKLPESNHPEWLNPYIENFSYTQDPRNLVFAQAIARYANLHNYTPVEAILAMSTDEDIIRDLARQGIKLTPMHDDKRYNYDRSKVPTKTDTHEPVTIGEHGHNGSGGGRPSTNAKVNGNDRMMAGHTHQLTKKGKYLSIGASFRDASYIRGGYTSWAGSTLGLLYQDGEQTHMLSRGPNYDYHRQEDAPPINHDAFFEPGYPRSEPGYANRGGVTSVDSTAIFSGAGKLGDNHPKAKKGGTTLAPVCSPALFRKKK